VFELVLPRIDRAAAIVAISVGVLAARSEVRPATAPRPAAIARTVEQPRPAAAPACDRASRAPRSYFKPLPAGPRSDTLHHIDELGYVDVDCDGVLDYTARHVAVTGPELVISSYLHRQRFYDYRIPLGSGACEATVAIDERTVEIVLARPCDRIVERYAIRGDRLYRNGRFVRRGE
jgi:hypothetical protein